MDSILDDHGLAPYRLVAKPGALAREGLFVAEGRLVLPQLLASRYRVHSVLVSESAREALQPLLSAHPHVPVHVATPEAISEIAGYDFHRGCLALAYRDDSIHRLAPVASSLRPAVILERVSNPDNIGGIFRTALAFGAAGIVLGPGCGDPLYRKAIRTSMGAALRVEWSIAANWPGDLEAMRAAGHTLVALTPRRDAAPLRDVIAAARAPVAFLLGSEGYGLSEEALAAADVSARIPIAEGVDSLNVSSAAAIALYEIGAGHQLRA